MGKPTSHRVPRRAALVAGAGSKAVPKCMSEPDSMPETVAGKHRRETMAGLRMLKAPKATRLNLANIIKHHGNESVCRLIFEEPCKLFSISVN